MSLIYFILEINTMQMQFNAESLTSTTMPLITKCNKLFQLLAIVLSTDRTYGTWWWSGSSSRLGSSLRSRWGSLRSRSSLWTGWSFRSRWGALWVWRSWSNNRWPFNWSLATRALCFSQTHHRQDGEQYKEERYLHVD